MRDNDSMIKCQWCGETRDLCACGAECPDDEGQPSKLMHVVENREVWLYGETNGRRHRLYKVGNVGDCLPTSGLKG